MNLSWDEKWILLSGKRKLPILLVDSLAECFREGFFAKNHGRNIPVTNYRQFMSERGISRKEYNAIVEFFKESDERLLFYAERLEKMIQKHTKTLVKLLPKPKKFDRKLFLKKFKKYFELYKDIGSMTYDYMILDKFYLEELNSVFVQKIPNVKELNSFLETVFSLHEPTDIKNEAKAIALIALNMKRKKLSFSSPQIQKMIKNYLEKFAFMGFCTYYGGAYTEQDVKPRIEKVLEKGVEKELQKILEQERIWEKRKKLLAKYGFDKKTLLKIKVARKWAYVSFTEDSWYHFSSYKLHPYLLLFCKEYGLSYNQVIELRLQELFGILEKNSVPKGLVEKLNDRVKDCYFLLEKGKTSIIEGRELQEFYEKNKHLIMDYSNLDRVQGVCAFSGKIRGKAKIVLTEKDISKVEKGDVLIAPGTQPSFVPAMENCSAIVTNDGGLLCHAAIVSRELKIPCVVGTKYATKVFKDNDLIEVDAEKGIVKKINC